MWRRSHVVISPSLLAALLFALAGSPRHGAAQNPNTGIIVGHVRAADTRAPIADAIVALAGSPRTARTDPAGRFALPAVPVGVHSLLIRRLGYRPATLEGIRVEGGGTVTVAAELARAAPPASLDTVVVRSAAEGGGGTPARPRFVLSREDIASAPQLAADAFRAVARVPGVSSGDFSAGFRVRGGSNREVLLLFDGMELYEPFHLKDLDGALSILDPEILGSASLSTGGFGARYGGHLTGVFDLRSREEPVAHSRTVVGASLSGVSAMREAQFASGRGDWLLSARRGFLDAALALAGEARRLSPHYYDAYARFRFRPTLRDEIALSALRAGDDLRYDADGGPRLSSVYGSSYAWLTWHTVPASRVAGRTTVSFARLDWYREGSDAYQNEPRLTVVDRRWFEALGVAQDWTIGLSEWADLELGGRLQRLGARYDYTRWQLRPRVALRRWVRDVDATDAHLDPGGTAIGVYLSQRLRPVPALTVEAGVRYDRQGYTEESTISPRVAAEYALGERTRLHAAWGRYAQPQAVYELQVSDGVHQFARAERAEHRVAGIEHRTAGGLRLSVDAYERRLLRLTPRYINLENSFDFFPEASGDRVLIAPTSGRARGVELSAASGRGSVQWAASYALAATQDRVNGEVVPHAFDQRHTLSLDLSVRPVAGWRVSAAWQFHSGWPVTPIDFLVDTLRNGTHHVRPRYGDLNAGRLAAYHRLDLRVTNDRKLGAGELSIYLDVFNVYDRDNPRGIGYTVADWNAAQAVVRRRRMSQLPRLPTIGVRWVF